MLPLLSCRAGGREKEGARSLTKPLCVKAWVVKACCTLWKKYVQLCDMSEQTPHSPSWLLRCTWAESDPHPQPSRLGGTGDRKLQAGSSEGACSGMFMERALSEDDDRLLMSQTPHLTCFGHLILLVFLTCGLNPSPLHYLMWCAWFSARFLWQTCDPQTQGSCQNSQAHCSQIDVASLPWAARRWPWALF